MPGYSKLGLMMMIVLLAALAAGAAVYGGRWLGQYADEADGDEDSGRASFFFECDDGSGVTISYRDEGDGALLSTPEGNFELSRLISASGARYGAGEIEFWSKGSEASYTRGGKSTRCRESYKSAPR